VFERINRRCLFLLGSGDSLRPCLENAQHALRSRQKETYALQDSWN
jgi:hypothetical protein